MEYTAFSLSIKDKVAHLAFNRPEALNTLTRAFWTELPAAIRDISDNARARVLVISSSGRHFTAGMDLDVFLSPQPVTAGDPTDIYVRNEAFRQHVHSLQDSFTALDEARIPVLAAIQGGCVGGGVDMVSACDMRYCAADAFFQIAEINIGMTADVGTFPRLCKLIPEGWVRELAYTGRRLPAARAKEIGLVNEVFPDHETLLSEVMIRAREIAEKNPVAVTGSKVMINYARDHSIRDALDYIATWQTGMWSPPHMAEALLAQSERRAPVYPDLVPIKKKM
ncbi:MAG: crotonase/enoyl-CoA hydratase family protein [Alphaproteobacteria bacterium]|nr:crotonase/enoyl-CoA hydratase family protein [Alphaproteobacteria bacterium]